MDSGLSKRRRAEGYRATSAGPNRSQLGVWLFVENRQSELGYKVTHRQAEQVGGAYKLQENRAAADGDLSSKNEPQSLENAIPWKENAITTG